MLTLNQLRLKLTSYLENHAQINTVVYGDEFTIAAERSICYPVARIDWLEGSASGKPFNHVFQVEMADLLDVNNPDCKHEIVSDLLQVAEDFITWLQYQEGFSFNKSTQILKLNDAYGDRVAGVRFRITLSVVRSQNECATPIKQPSHE